MSLEYRHAHTSKKKNKQSIAQTATVLIMNEDKPIESVEMNVWFLRHAKKIVTGLTASVAVLAVALTITGVGQIKASSDNKLLSEQINALKSFNSAETASKISELKQSEKTINALQNYLQERGISPDGKSNVTQAPDAGNNKTAPMGGEYRPVSAETPFGSRFNAKASAIYDAIKEVPLGIPYEGPITSGFGNRSNPFGGGGGENHPGIDFKGPVGSEIHATADGVVIQAGVIGGYGNAVKIAHGYRLETLYGHMSALKVKVGQIIKAGDVVGLLGSTGRSTGPHLHYEVRRDGTPIDPADFLAFK